MSDPLDWLGQRLKAQAGNLKQLADEVTGAATEAIRNAPGNEVVHEWLAMADAGAVGDRVYAEIADAFVIDTDWAHEQAQRVAGRLNEHRLAVPLIPVVVWSKEPTAAAVPGKYIYISRELMQDLITDAAVAFVLAHEMAHVDLGHLDLDAGVGDVLRRLPRAVPVRVAVGMASRVVRRPELELAADEAALRLCLKAGYDRTDCLVAFYRLEKILLDRGDLDGVFGIPEDPDATFGFGTRLAEWWRQRTTGYASVRDRRERLERAVPAEG